MNHIGKNGLNLGSKDSRKNVQPEMLISALENIPGGFHQCALEEGYPFLYMNERFLEILGWTKEEIEEQFDNKFTNLMADEDRDLVDNFVARILEGSSAKETKRQIYRLKSKNGLIWVSNATNLVREGDHTFLQGIITDINEQKEQELNYKEQMEMAIVKANRANREKTLFLRRMSHDIRTPLNGILGMIHLADKNKDNVEKLYDYRQKTIHSAEYLMDLVNNILDISKLESGSMVLDDKPFDLFALLERQTEIIEAYANDNTVQLINAIDHQKMKHRYLIGSKNYLNRILMNLASNAVKYNHVGGWVKLNCEEIFDDGDSCVYEFICQDNGLGMSEEFQRHAFEPFCREGKESTTTLSGTGLGLSIVKEIAELMHGTIQLKSKEGEGTTFVVTIPFKIDPHPQPENKELVIPENISFKGQTAMLVEDNDVNMEIAHFFLEELGFQIISAKNGKEALELFQKEPENTFDFIFMDVMMPVMDGLEATKRIRALPSAYAKKIPILAMTANAFQEDRQSCLEAGMNGHIAKPLKKEDIIKELLRSQEAK